MASSNFSARAAACGDWRSAPARLCGAMTISTRAPSVLPRAGAGEAARPESDARGAEASSEVDGSGSRRGPTLSETHSETSAPRIIKTRAAVSLVVAASLAIFIEMIARRETMFARPE
jgi:hypothetical protein